MGLFDFFKKKKMGRKCSFCGKALLPSDPGYIALDRLQCADCYNKKTEKVAETKDTTGLKDVDIPEAQEGKTETIRKTNGSPVLTLAKEQAIETLRRDIIAKIQQTKSLTYELASLVWEDAARCFPNAASFQWDGAWFRIDLDTKKLFVDVSTYPNQFGASRSAKFSISALEFYQKAMEYDFSPVLKFMQSESDWDLLFNDHLNAIISEIKAYSIKQNEDREREEQRKNAIVISDELKKSKPTMEFTKLKIELDQRYGGSSVSLVMQGDLYVLAYNYIYYHNADGHRRHKRALSLPEAVWIENEINSAVNNEDHSTWRSLPGGDKMMVVIEKNHEIIVSIENGLPTRKYTDLLHALEKMARYGSR